MELFKGYSKFEKILMEEGYSKDDAKSKLLTNISNLNPSYFFEELPINFSKIKSEEKYQQILENVANKMHITELERQTKDILRYLSHWTENSKIETVNYIIESLIEGTIGPKSDILGFNFALYINNILENELINKKNKNKIISSIDSFGHYIPALANLTEEIPKQLKEKFNEAINIDKVIETDAIQSLRYSGGKGIYCIGGRRGHHNSIVAPFIELSKRKKSEISEELYQPKFSKNEGKVALVYIGNILMGSIKIRKNPNLLALRTVRDSNGKYPLVLGGVYGIQEYLIEIAEKLKLQNKKWTRLDLDSLKAYPIKHISQEDYGLVHRSFTPYNEELIYVRNKIEKK